MWVYELGLLCLVGEGVTRLRGVAERTDEPRVSGSVFPPRPFF